MQYVQQQCMRPPSAPRAMPSVSRYPWCHKDFYDCLSPGAVQSVLLTPYQANNKHRPLVDYPRRHIKHAHLQS